MSQTVSAQAGVPAPPKGARPGRFRRVARRSLSVLLLLAGLYLCRAPLLRALASGLVVDQACTSADRVLLLGGDRCHDEAAALWEAGEVQGILLVGRRPGRLVRLGILSSRVDLDRRELRARGVPGRALAVLGESVRDDWDMARALRGWLAGHPDPPASVVLLCDQLGSRRVRLILDRTLGKALAGRVRVRALPGRDFDDTNWWQSKAGLAHLFDCCVGLGYTWLCGEDDEGWREWQPEEYERDLAR
jgi:hypothetical protein